MHYTRNGGKYLPVFDNTDEELRYSCKEYRNSPDFEVSEDGKQLRFVWNTKPEYESQVRTRYYDEESPDGYRSGSVSVSGREYVLVKASEHIFTSQWIPLQAKDIALSPTMHPVMIQDTVLPGRSVNGSECFPDKDGSYSTVFDLEVDEIPAECFPSCVSREAFYQWIWRAKKGRIRFHFTWEADKQAFVLNLKEKSGQAVDWQVDQWQEWMETTAAFLSRINVDGKMYTYPVSDFRGKDGKQAGTGSDLVTATATVNGSSFPVKRSEQPDGKYKYWILG